MFERQTIFCSVRAAGRICGLKSSRSRSGGDAFFILRGGGGTGEREGEREREVSGEGTSHYQLNPSKKTTRRESGSELRQALKGKSDLPTKNSAQDGRSWPSWPVADQAADSSASASSPFGQSVEGERSAPCRCLRCFCAAHGVESKRRELSF